MTGPELALFTEDGSKRAPDVLVELVKKTALQVHEDTQTHRLTFRFAAGPPRDAFVGHRWRSAAAKDQPLRRQLVDHLATQVTLGSLVVVHVDGDIPWTDPHTRCAYDDALTRLIQDVQRRIESLRPANPPIAADHILLLIPHYSIESWLYLNHDKLTDDDLKREGIDARHARNWLSVHDPTGFDHLHQPKEACPLRDKFNHVLASQWPAAVAATRSPSYAATLTRWRDTPRLLAALASTAEQFPPSPG